MDIVRAGSPGVDGLDQRVDTGDEMSNPDILYVPGLVMGLRGGLGVITPERFEAYPISPGVGGWLLLFIGMMSAFLLLALWLLKPLADAVDIAALRTALKLGVLLIPLPIANWMASRLASRRVDKIISRLHVAPGRPGGVVPRYSIARASIVHLRQRRFRGRLGGIVYHDERGRARRLRIVSERREGELLASALGVPFHR